MIGPGPCAKQTVTATLVAIDGRRFVGTNECATPQTVCPRAGMKTGEGYHLCRQICHQDAHAEVNAVLIAGPKNSNGATIYLEGHTYACEPCKKFVAEFGVVAIVIGCPP